MNSLIIYNCMYRTAPFHDLIVIFHEYMHFLLIIFITCLLPHNKKSIEGFNVYIVDLKIMFSGILFKVKPNCRLQQQTSGV